MSAFWTLHTNLERSPYQFFFSCQQVNIKPHHVPFVFFMNFALLSYGDDLLHYWWILIDGTTELKNKITQTLNFDLLRNNLFLLYLKYQADQEFLLVYQRSVVNHAQTMQKATSLSNYIISPLIIILVQYHHMPIQSFCVYAITLEI